MEFLMRTTWSPYLVGVGIGVLSWFSFLFSRKALGASTTFARTSGLIWEQKDSSVTDRLSYYRDYAPKIDWQMMLVVGIFVGSFISSVLSGSFSVSMRPPTDYPSFLNITATGRFFSALIGGIFIGFGARFAGGCTSGHGISGTLQLSISSWIAAACFFIGGIAAALVIL